MDGRKPLPVLDPGRRERLGVRVGRDQDRARGGADGDHPGTDAHEGLHQGGTGGPGSLQHHGATVQAAQRGAGRRGDPGGQEGVGQRADARGRGAQQRRTGVDRGQRRQVSGRQPLARVQRRAPDATRSDQLGAEGGDRLGPALGRGADAGGGAADLLFQERPTVGAGAGHGAGTVDQHLLGPAGHAVGRGGPVQVGHDEGVGRGELLQRHGHESARKTSEAGWNGTPRARSTRPGRTPGSGTANRATRPGPALAG